MLRLALAAGTMAIARQLPGRSPRAGRLVPRRRRLPGGEGQDRRDRVQKIIATGRLDCRRRGRYQTRR
jgi:hypothetical protein